MKRLVIFISTIMVTLILILTLGIYIPRIIFECTLKMPNESDVLPAYVEYGVLHIENNKVNISCLCQEQNENASLEEIFCIAGGKGYFVYSDITGWTIASVDIKTGVFQDHCRFENTAAYYRRNIYSAYGDRNGYFHDGKIILSDFENVFTYDVRTGETHTYAYADYIFPQRTIYGECTADKTLNLFIGNDVYSFSMEDMAAESEGIARIVALKDKKNWDKKSYLAGFLLRDSIQSIGESIYCVDSVIDYFGYPYVVILEYNREQGNWQYVTSNFCGWDTYGNCYVIPTI